MSARFMKLAERFIVRRRDAKFFGLGQCLPIEAQRSILITFFARDQSLPRQGGRYAPSAVETPGPRLGLNRILMSRVQIAFPVADKTEIEISAALLETVILAKGKIAQCGGFDLGLIIKRIGEAGYAGFQQAVGIVIQRD